MHGRMKYRPPVRTSEIFAYNWGARGRSCGLSLADLAPMDNFTPRLDLSPSELDHLAALGPDAWHRWAARGWVEAPEPEAI